MKTIKQYNNDEKVEMIKRHNSLVKPNYKFNEISGMEYLISEADDQDLVSTYF